MVIHGKFGKSATALCWFTIMCCVIVESSMRPKMFSGKQEAVPEDAARAPSSESLAIPSLMASSQKKPNRNERLEHSVEKSAAMLRLSSL